jgi:hypothetical protein
VPFGLGTEGLKIGDQVFAVVGCSTPFIFRPVGDFHIVVGNAKMFPFANCVSFQDNLARFPRGIFVVMTLRYFYTKTKTTLNCHSLANFVLDKTIVFIAVGRFSIVVDRCNREAQMSCILFSPAQGLLALDSANCSDSKTEI